MAFFVKINFYLLILLTISFRFFCFEWEKGAFNNLKFAYFRNKVKPEVDVIPFPPGGGGGGGAWALGYLGGRIRSLSKLKNTLKALISGQKITLVLIKTFNFFH